MKKVNKKSRDKAFWGALIGAGISAATSLIGEHINNEHQKFMAQLQYDQQKRLLERQDVQNEYNQKLQEQIAEQENDGIYDELRRKNYKCGGKMIKRKKGEWGLSDYGAIGTSLINGLGSLGTTMMNANTQSQLASYQMKLAEDKFNSEAKKLHSYTGQSSAKSLRAYIDGTEDDNQFDGRYKNLFQNKRMYLS